MKFRKKPVVIEAIQWTRHNAKEIFDFMNIVPGPKDSTSSGDIFRIPTLEGVMAASADDWIIKGIKGEFYPCKPDIFEATYEKVEEFTGEKGAPFDQ